MIPYDTFYYRAEISTICVKKIQHFCLQKKNKNTCHGFQQLCKSPIKLFGTVDQNEKLVTWINVSFSFFSSLDTIFFKKNFIHCTTHCDTKNHHFIQVPTVDRIFVCWGPKLCKRTTSLVKGYNVMRLANKFRLVGISVSYNITHNFSLKSSLKGFWFYSSW